MRQPTDVDLEWLQSLFPTLTGLEPLGAGGQKQVFSAKHPTEGDVVLKFLKPPVDLEAIRREIEAVSKIESERIPRILGVGEITTPMGPCVWFRETRILGQTLRSRLGSGPLDLPSILHFGLQMLRCLAAAERARIVHRDVKPDNVIIDPNGDYWLLDFGIARHLDLNSLTDSGDVRGKCTPDYAPPEQFRNLKTEIDARCDLFALGVTIVECAAGVNPFRFGARDALETCVRVETMRLSPLPDSFPLEFRELVAAMTQKRRVHRPQTAQQALGWMEEIYGNQSWHPGS